MEVHPANEGFQPSGAWLGDPNCAPGGSDAGRDDRLPPAVIQEADAALQIHPSREHRGTQGEALMKSTLFTLCLCLAGVTSGIDTDPRAVRARFTPQESLAIRARQAERNWRRRASLSGSAITTSVSPAFSLWSGLGL